jgi:N-methylhydantoinase A/oxoprolinase/acetone carboxylase beta subunit
VEKISADFHDAHEREYSRRFEESDIEIPNIRVRGVGVMPQLETPEVDRGDESPEEALRHEREAWFRVDGELRQVQTKYYAREALKAGNRVQGPAVINQLDSTTVIPPGFTADVDRFGNIVITIDALAAQQLVGTGEQTANV